MGAQPFSAAPFIKEIGRGKEGARSLGREQARELFSALLQGRVSELELGAVLLCFRVKGETAQELMGFIDAIEAQLDGPAPEAVQPSVLPTVVLPSYNGARRKANLTPLLAGYLVRRGYPVLIHGIDADPTGRITTASVVHALGWPVLSDKTQLHHELKKAHEQGLPLFAPISRLHPALHGLLQKRAVLGVRNSAHTVVKLFNPLPGQPVLQLASYTHPEFLNLQREVLAGLGAQALVLRGHEGEAVAQPLRAPRMDAVKQGKTWLLHEGDHALVGMPVLDNDTRAEHTAQYILSALHADQSPAHGFEQQLKAIDAVVQA